MHNGSSARKRHGEEMPRYTALSTAEELAASCQPRRHAPHAGGLLPRLFGHLLFCYTCVMSTLLCPLLAVVVRPFAPLLPRPIRGASLFRLVALVILYMRVFIGYLRMRSLRSKIAQAIQA